MSDPVSIGALVASVLSKAIEAGAGEFGKSAGKGAFEAFKAKVSHWAGREVAALEDAPDSPKRLTAVAEIIDRQAQEEREALRVLAEALIDELKAASQVGPIGVDIGELEAKRVNLPPMIVTEGIGLRVDKMKLRGEFTGSSVNVGKH